MGELLGNNHVHYTFEYEKKLKDGNELVFTSVDYFMKKVIEWKKQLKEGHF